MPGKRSLTIAKKSGRSSDRNFGTLVLSPEAVWATGRHCFTERKGVQGIHVGVTHGSDQQDVLILNTATWHTHLARFVCNAIWLSLGCAGLIWVRSLQAAGHDKD